MVADGVDEALGRVADAAERIAQAVDPGCRLLGVAPLEGGASTHVLLLDVERADGAHVRRVVRRHGAANLERDPDTAANEFRLLRFLRERGVPVPEALHLDTSCRLLPTPYLVLDFVEGSTDIAPAQLDGAVDVMADHLLRMHAIGAEDADVAFVLDQARLLAWWLAHPPEQLDASLDEGLIRGALTASWPWPSSGPSVLLHGDFWPRNVLWRDGHLAAILDWEDAARGDPLADLAITRLELLWAFGTEAAERFTRRYLAASSVDPATLPLWDLAAALRPAGRLSEWADGDAQREAAMRRAHAAFTADALARAGF